jgi:mannose-1-phosphate guanylyltransferase
VAVKRVQGARRYGVAAITDGRIVGFAEKPDVPDEPPLSVSCGIYTVACELVADFPEGTVYDFGAHLIPELVAAGRHVHAHQFTHYWNDIGDHDSFRRANLDVVSGRVRHEIALPAGSRLIGEPAAPILVGPRTRISPRSMILGPAVIGADCSVGGDVRIDRSVVLPGSTVPDGEVVTLATFQGDRVVAMDGVP